MHVASTQTFCRAPSERAFQDLVWPGPGVRASSCSMSSTSNDHGLLIKSKHAVELKNRPLLLVQALYVVLTDFSIRLAEDVTFMFSFWNTVNISKQHYMYSKQHAINLRQRTISTGLKQAGTVRFTITWLNTCILFSQYSALMIDVLNSWQNQVHF